MLFLAVAAQAQQAVMTRHVREVVADGQAQLVGVLPRSQQMHLAIVLPVRDEAALGKLLKQIYDQQSPSYHHYLSVQQFADRFGPTHEDYDAVVQFAKANGMSITSTPPNRRLVEVNASVVDIEKAFHITMGVYKHPTEERTFYSPDREPTIDLDVPIWHISGLDSFSLPHPMYVKSESPTGVSNTTGSGPDGDFLGSDRRAAYYGGTALTGSGQSLGLVEFDGYALSDVQAYFKNVGQTLSVPINNVLLDGASSGSDGDDTEQVIDIIVAASMAPGLSQVRVYIAPLSTVFTGGDTIIFNQMATDNIAKQLSCSWNWSPDDPTKDDPIFEEFAAQGQSFFAASGDDGSWPNQPYYYPEEDANVTAVGGTDLTTNGAGGSWASETAWSGSGGGISPDHFIIPSYQQLPGVINASNKGSTAYRNAPDVAAEANTDNYYCANGFCSEGLGGTSLAAPTWAGFMALVNEQNLANEETIEGFLNPTIYAIGVSSSYATYFHDITNGSNGTYSAVTGYDLVTGWGSPLGSGWVAAPVQTNWPSSCFTSANDCYNPYETVIGPGNVGSLVALWAFVTRTWPIGRPVVDNGVLYVGSENGKYYAFNAKTGASQWTFTFTCGSTSIYSATVAGGVVYLITTCGTLYALNASTGAQLWTWSNASISSPAVSGGIVYAWGGSGLLYALNASTGAQLWTFNAGTSAYPLPPPTVASGVLYVGNGGLTTLYALNASTGATLWTFSPSGGVDPGPVVAGEALFTVGGDHLYALNPNTGAELWTSSLCYGDVIVANSVVYCYGTQLYALNASTGAELWTSATSGEAAAVANGIIYTVTSKTIYALNANTGAELATYALTEETIESGPIIVNGVLYFTVLGGPGGANGQLDAWAP
jgi:kumamolisin